ncbi:hypothetical protein [Geobacter argillaceus]|uniref:Uncharacterized protein n=1 Tax=Geobacter argillaceus TaxID=345631 RepID=A0A562VNT9_9BACT|nr:hypothetical protein [Geobacter argillaceus]TWJ19414.1 hypothetical protein JN12_01830 [Geobacter argillaceus]
MTEINKSDFDIESLEDELRVDGLCQSLLRRFYDKRLAAGLTQRDATLLANSADYYLRDFVVDRMRRNPFDEPPGLIRQFAGNWYIVNTLEPNVDELARHLAGIRAFYHFLHGEGLISAGFLQAVEAECEALPWFSSRIDSFWSIEEDGYYTWERECSLKE